MKKAITSALFSMFFAFGAVLAHAADLNLTIPLPLTGKQAKFGEIQKRSYEIAAAEINAAGGVKGNKLVLKFEDSGAKPDIARGIVEKLIDVQKQPIIIGEYTSACAKAVAAVSEERKTPYLVVVSGNDDITQANYKYVFRLNSPNAYYADGVLGFMKEVVKPKTIAILYESSDFGSSGAEEMAKHAEASGIKVLLKEKYESGAVDFKPILSKVKSLRPDVLYMVSYVMDASLLMRQIKELRLDANLFAGGAAGFAIPEFIDNAKDASDYVVTSTLWSPQVKYAGAKQYAEKYKKQFGDYPSYHGAAAYAALFVAKDALERAKTWSPEDIRAAMKATKMQTAFGPVQFVDKNGYQNQNFIPTLALQVIKGQHETIWPKSMASAKFLYPMPKWRERK
ncbi:ABC transporter substrate-binding protein [Seleniivibrio woodruffii]|uniref:Amino acid/amide ABC transporter substrate-binding protein (HAAT family) n=1 Tax=Seleniivibrio woodruffii TaxID=1078050 RepID=A0A4R1K6F5_9BACT|nr:ABC transporter substrate-binding protein [Seleniivibrio woodruffii]TCK59343.1 amino acid/amide ABC transporter substrate-binding protein (HAAT family) [Seleniivibrio woodruffii]TVZ35618.1 amino acid/amide ABC transporter substrate-binding protein (HAAT family) [Seleniivibrio woodruffii]